MGRCHWGPRAFAARGLVEQGLDISSDMGREDVAGNHLPLWCPHPGLAFQRLHLVGIAVEGLSSQHKKYYGTYQTCCTPIAYCILQLVVSTSPVYFHHVHKVHGFNCLDETRCRSVTISVGSFFEVS